MTKPVAAKHPETTEDETAEAEYDAFEALTRKLLAVSKKDLDEARASEEAEKR